MEKFHDYMWLHTPSIESTAGNKNRLFPSPFRLSQFLSCPFLVGFATVNAARKLNGLRFRLFKLGGLIGSCCPNPYSIVGLFESVSTVTNCGARDAIDDIDMISWVSLPDISVDLKTKGMFGLGRFGPLDDCST